MAGTSSTSSFEHAGERLPTIAPRAAILALVLGFALTASWEGMLIATGAPIEATPNQADAALQRMEQPPAEGKRRVLLLGSSRIMAGVRPDTLEAIEPAWDARIVAMYAISGPHELIALEDLLVDGDIAVVEVLPVAAYTDRPGQLLQHLESRVSMISRNREIEEFVSSATARLRSSQPDNSPTGLIHRELRNALGLKEPPSGVAGLLELQEQADGQVRFDLVKRDDERFRAIQDEAARQINNYARPSDEARFAGVIARLEPVVDRLGQRGVSVVLVRMPSSGPSLDAERVHFPREKFWDRLAERFPTRCLHYEDLPEFRGLWLPDGSHMLQPDAERFTRALAKWMHPRVNE